MGSLDLYKPELIAFLYPIFIHSYLDLIERGFHTAGLLHFYFFWLIGVLAASFLKENRGDQLATLQPEIDEISGHYFSCFVSFFIPAVLHPEQMRENGVVKRLRENKFTIEMSRYAFLLLLTFLQERKFMILISIINTRTSIKSTALLPLLPLSSCIHWNDVTLFLLIQRSFFVLMMVELVA